MPQSPVSFDEFEPSDTFESIIAFGVVLGGCVEVEVVMSDELDETESFIGCSVLSSWH